MYALPFFVQDSSQLCKLVNPACPALGILPAERLEVRLSLNFCTTLSHGMAAFFSVTKKLITTEVKVVYYTYNLFACSGT